MAAAAQSPMGIPEKDLYRIGEVSQITSTKSFVLRYWETEFPMLQPVKSPSGHRMYRREDIETVLKIRRLLYEEGFTIAGARKHLTVGTDSSSYDRPSTAPAASRPSFATSTPFSSSSTAGAASVPHTGAESAQASFLDSESESTFHDEAQAHESFAQPEVEARTAADFDAETPVPMEKLQGHFISEHPPFADDEPPAHELQPATRKMNFSAPQASAAAPVAHHTGLSEAQKTSLRDVREELRAILTLLERE
jgi:DNA-binding transcriptional MerR regulator